MIYQTLQLSHEDRIATLTLNRPDKRNAISRELIDEFLAATDEVLHSEAQVLIITGAGKSFCSGMDLDDLRAQIGRSEIETLNESQKVAGLFRFIYEFRIPTIAAVNGPAIAGGCGIATLCDFTIASTEAKLGYTEVRIGFVPAIVSAFLTRQVGDKIARDLLLTGRIISAEEALRLGVVTEVVSPGDLMPRSRAIASLLAESSPLSLRATKRLLSTFTGNQLDEEIRVAIEENARIRATDDFREGVSAFLEKRKPRWSGR